MHSEVIIRLPWKLVKKFYTNCNIIRVISYEVIKLEKNNYIVENEILDEKHHQTQLKTEWAIITSPKNLEKLASKYSKSLKLKPISGNQILINSKNRDEVN